ncbi:MAG: hypothetical protein RR708_05055 [Bacilli bacterium]
MKKESICLKVCEGTKQKIKERMAEIHTNTMTQYIINLIQNDLERKK